MMRNMKTIALIEDKFVKDIVRIAAKNCVYSIDSGTAFYCDENIVIVLQNKLNGIMGNRIPRKVCLSLCDVQQENNSVPYDMQKISEQISELYYKDLIIINKNMLDNYITKDMQEYLYFADQTVLRDIKPLEKKKKEYRQLEIKRYFENNHFGQQLLTT